MKKTGIVFLGLLFALSAQAAFTGTWNGTGEWTFQGQGADCTSMNIQFQENATTLSRVKGYFDCGFVALESGPQSWEKRDGQLFLNGNLAGAIDETGFDTWEPYGNEGVKIHTLFWLRNNKVDYQEEWFGSDGRQIYLIKGEFEKK